jgi:hypothetical protein
MAVDTKINGLIICQIHLARGDESARLAMALDGMFERGSIVEPTADFSGEIVGQGEIASQYTLSNWLAGISSGALYAFRALKVPRRRLLLSYLSGSLQASSMTALATATAIGIAKLAEKELPALDLEDWVIDCEVDAENKSSC